MKYILLFILILLVGCREKETKQTCLPLNYEFEGWKTDKNIIRLGEVFYGDIPADTVRVCNRTSKRRSCRFLYDISFLQVTAQPEYLNPGDTGRVIVRLQTQQWGRYGDVLATLRWMREDGMPGTTMVLTAHVKENFQHMSVHERAKAPRFFMTEREHDFGRLKEGEKANWKARIENKGQKDLMIRHITTPCGCTAVVPEKKVIPPGETSLLDITFNTAGRAGRQQKTITVICNDWREPEVQIRLKATVEKI